MFYINLLNSPNQIMVLLGILCFGILADQVEQLMKQSSEDAQGSYYDVAGHVDRKYCCLPRSWAALCGTDSKIFLLWD